MTDGCGALNMTLSWCFEKMLALAITSIRSLPILKEIRFSIIISTPNS